MYIQIYNHIVLTLASERKTKELATLAALAAGHRQHHQPPPITTTKNYWITFFTGHKFDSWGMCFILQSQL